MGEALRDRYSCRGIQSRLRHVADFPLSRSKEEAVQWFEGSPAFNRDVSNSGSNNGHLNGRMRVDGNDYGRGGGLKLKRGTKPKKDDDERENTNLNSKNRNQKNETQTAKTPTDEEPQETHSSYGTTQVNILTVRPVPVLSPDEAQRNQQLMADPFGGFGNVANAGMLNPFGSLFGGFFGGGGGVPSSFPASSSSSSMMSRSVSSSTRMTRDENGKRIATTVTKTTTVDGTGKKRVETETSVRYLDDEGGRVETTKQVVEDGASSSAGTDGAAATPQPKKEKRRHTARSLSPRGFEDSDHHPLPFHQSQSPSRPSSRPIVDGGGAVVDPSVPPSPPEVAEIATNLRLGLAVTDGPSSDPDNPNEVVRKSNKSSSSGGWRKTEYLFRLGRFVSPFMVVSQYYEDKEEEERRRKELTKEYNERRQRQKENRWGRFSEKQRQDDKSKQDGGSSSSGGEDESTEGTSTNFPLPADLPVDTSQLEYYFQRLHTQMEKNAAMMEIMVKQVLKPDFPQKVVHSGERILENMGPTAERTGKLMKDVWTMWVGSWDGGGDGDGRGGGGRR